MKKLLSLLLALAMLLGCTAFAEGVDYTGTWVLTGGEAEGVQMGPTTLALVGLDMKFVLTADGNLTLYSMGVEETATWVATENGIAITDTDGTMEVLYQNEMLVLDQGNVVLMLTREGAEPAVAEATGPVAQAGVPAEAFEGQWLMYSVNMMGMEITAEQVGMYMAFVLTNGAGIMGTNEGEDGSIVTDAVVYTVTEVEGVGTVLAISPAEVPEGEEAEALELCMAEDGTLFLEEEGAYMIFVKQVEETPAE